MNLVACIGSRNAAFPDCERMTQCAYNLARDGFIIRSGGAKGMDHAAQLGVENFFEEYIVSRKGRHFLELYRPTPDWHNLKSWEKLFTPPADSSWHEMARRFYRPRHGNKWESLDSYVQGLFARNAAIILGPDLKTPVKKVIYWTDDEIHSGTAHSLRIARYHNIPTEKLT